MYVFLVHNSHVINHDQANYVLISDPESSLYLAAPDVADPDPTFKKNPDRGPDPAVKK